MKRQDIKKLHQLTADELQQKLQELRQELLKVQLAKQAGKATNPKLVSHLRDDVARVLTVMKEK